MKLEDLVFLKKQGKNVAEELNNFYNEKMDSEDICLEFGAVYEDAISYDCDFEQLLELLGVRVEKVVRNGKDLGFKYNNYLYLYDFSTQVIVPFVEDANRHDEDLGDEMFIFFNNFVELDASYHLSCDECRKLFLRDALINLDPVNETDDEFKEEYKGYDGMVCEECYTNMAN